MNEFAIRALVREAEAQVAHLPLDEKVAALSAAQTLAIQISNGENRKGLAKLADRINGALILAKRRLATEVRNGLHK